MTTENTRLDGFVALRELNHPPLTFGRMLRSLRLCEEESQQDFANRLGISRQDLNNVESERTPVSLKRALEFAVRLGFPREVFAEVVLQEMARREGLDVTVQVNKPA